MNGRVSVTPLHGIPEVTDGDDLADLIEGGLSASGLRLEPGDVVVVSSKIASKALGLVVDDLDKDRVVAAETDYVVAERSLPGRVTRVVRAKAGPVMAAAGVDGSNTGARGGWLVLPRDPDGVCRELHDALRARHGVELGVILSDTAGRPWRVGQVDFALGAWGLHVLEDLRGGVDADGRALEVTTRAVADEIAAAADLVKGKASHVPVAVVRGLGELVVERPDASLPGGRDLVRAGAEDWFGHGQVEAVRAALGIEPGTALSQRVGIPPAVPDARRAAVGRAVAVALHAVARATADVGPDSVVLGADGPYALGRVTARLEAALWSEGLAGVPDPPSGDGRSVTVAVTAS
ncbi:MAG TPA: coenzyme F420-0:L-glutamate ligase [Intrasporangium sp.]|uniref:coenzyme F420-0:L-glutamate ligase n=1 Tax=Intrasporangium sp. TaxID=1925024 RepID=UPI002D78170C|nr:coenzyme F420-0:L-glutamate ligase [Intrasporangium sp.]HET7398331.1 coenzyme F420-0:L-glutamate ligase [Intrasporangium sp.]